MTEQEYGELLEEVADELDFYYAAAASVAVADDLDELLDSG
ncbi:hypothetical protein ACFCYM_27655 [Streptomyces sp. NPDC056254]